MWHLYRRKWQCIAVNIAVIALATTLSPTHGKGEARIVKSLAGSSVFLPCAAMDHPREDTPVLLLFYKPSSNIPFYSFDARGSNSWEQGSPKIRDPRYAGRVSLDLSESSNVSLKIKKVSVRDEGDYTCRVDFLGSPSMTSVVKLRVFENPISGPLIYVRDELSGSTIVPTTTLGPYYEGDNLTIQCVVTGGHPEPSVTWWQDSVFLSNSTTVIPGTTKKFTNEMILGPLSRDLVRVPFTCRSQNNPLSAPLEKSVEIKIYMAPTAVLLPQEPIVRAGKEEVLECIARETYPEATMTWELNGEPLKYVSLETKQVDQDTVTKVRFISQPHNNGDILSCSAFSEKLSKTPITASSKLNVTHAPLVNLTLGSNLRLEEIRQGADVYFECHVVSNPPAFNIKWFKNEIEVNHDKKNGVLVGGNNLVLQRIQRKDAGNYSCEAVNSVGSTMGLPIHLTVYYAPTCMQSPKVITAVEGDVLTLECKVDAHPSNVTFYWLFNNTVDSTKFRETEYDTNNSVSRLRYVAYTARDYGTLFCWAQNAVASQKTPCSFTLQAAGAPESVRGCILNNQSLGSLQITCKPGADGGLTQSFRAEVFRHPSQPPVRILEGMIPNFTVEGLASGGDYVVRVTAINKKGASTPISLEAYTLKVAENRMTAGVTSTNSPEPTEKPTNKAAPNLTMLFGVFGGILLSSLAMIGFTALGLKLGCTGSNANIIIRMTRRANAQSNPSMLTLSTTTSQEKQIGGGSIQPIGDCFNKGGEQVILQGQSNMPAMNIHVCTTGQVFTIPPPPQYSSSQYSRESEEALSNNLQQQQESDLDAVQVPIDMKPAKKDSQDFENYSTVFGYQYNDEENIFNNNGNRLSENVNAGTNIPGNIPRSFR